MTRVTVGSAGAAVEVHDLPEHISYSQLTMLDPKYKYACGRKWAYRYRLKLPEARTPALAVGSAIDEAINAFFLARLRGIEPMDAGALGIEAGTQRLRAEDPIVWETGEGYPQDVAQQYEDILVAAFAAFAHSEGSAKVARVQDRHIFNLGLDDRHIMPVVGYSDRIDTDGTLVDHKFSGSPRWDKDGNWHEDWVGEKRDQLLIYWLARQAEERRTGQPLDPPLNGRGRLVVIYHRLGLLRPQVHAKEMALNFEAGGAELLERLAHVAREVQADHYPARPGEACRFCPYLSRCREDEASRGTPFFDLIEVPF